MFLNDFDSLDMDFHNQNDNEYGFSLGDDSVMDDYLSHMSIQSNPLEFSDYDFNSFSWDVTNDQNPYDLFNNHNFEDNNEHAHGGDSDYGLHRSAISFGSSEGNRYDRNALDFLKDCSNNSIEFPSSVDHSLNNTDMKVDRSINGGFTSIDKSIMKNTLEQYYSNGKITEDIYNNLLRKLTNC